MSTDRETVAFYDENAARYAEYSSETAEHPKLDRFLSDVTSRAGVPARVLDLGCGTGWAAAAMAAIGHRVDAIDASAGLAAEALARHALTVRVAGFRTLSARQRYDGIWCHFGLQHADRADRPQIFERLHNALRLGGLLYVGVQKGPRDWRDDLGRLYCPFREDEMTDLLTTAGFAEFEFEHGTGKNFDGTPTLNLYVWAQARG